MYVINYICSLYFCFTLKKSWKILKKQDIRREIIALEKISRIYSTPGIPVIIKIFFIKVSCKCLITP